jgi:hypothetical protein
MEKGRVIIILLVVSIIALAVYSTKFENNSNIALSQKEIQGEWIDTCADLDGDDIETANVAVQIKYPSNSYHPTTYDGVTMSINPSSIGPGNNPYFVILETSGQLTYEGEDGRETTAYFEIFPDTARESQILGEPANLLSHRESIMSSSKRVAGNFYLGPCKERFRIVSGSIDKNLIVNVKNGETRIWSGNNLPKAGDLGPTEIFAVASKSSYDS